MGRLVEVADTRLYVEERGVPSAFPLLVFHGGPGLDHTWFGDYLDPLTEGGRYRLVLADERACGRSDRSAPRPTWTLARMAQDVSDLAASLGVAGGYATLGHSYGAFVVLQHAVDHPPGAARHDRVGGHRRCALAPRGGAAAGGVRAGRAAPAGDVVVGAGDLGADRGRGERADRGSAAVPLPRPERASAAGIPAPDRRARPVCAGCHPPFFLTGLRRNRRRNPAR